MVPTKDFVLKSLLQKSFFPVQKKNREELPPIFNSESFTKDVAVELNKIASRKGGYDQVEYKGTRFNNVHRVFSIPHPKPYAQLATFCSEHWDDINYICKNKNSLIVPKMHDDGRLVIMDYESSWIKSRRKIRLSSNKKFVVHTDISNCFSSIYSHAIPWALVGHSQAKKNKHLSKEWFNQIDQSQQSSKRCETQGLAIGPATSNILSEIILAKVDEELSAFNYVRFIDDYTCYCKTYEECEKFIQCLSRALNRYGLTLNIKKTSINKLPNPINADWITNLNLRNPVGDEVHWSQVISFLDYAVGLEKEVKEGSIIKYAVKTIHKRINQKHKKIFLEHLLYLAQHYPVIVPVISETLNSVLANDPEYSCESTLLFLLSESITNQRSDSVSWLLHYLIKHKRGINDELSGMIIENEDCVPILMLSLMKEHEANVVDFCNKVIDKKDNYEIDKYWLLLYQLFYQGKVANPYEDQEDQKVFNKLKERKVDFIDLTKE